MQWAVVVTVVEVTGIGVIVAVVVVVAVIVAVTVESQHLCTGVRAWCSKDGYRMGCKLPH